MEKKFENLTEITDRKTYDDVVAYLDDLESYATRNGYLKDMDSRNEYTREMGRVGGILADYESIYMEFKYLQIKKPVQASPVQSSSSQRRSHPRVRRF
ncbi:hypothetical protein [Leadbetterella sp. DM7]|uniref:hypothetical protein n=1 Tax=Leadbetterella sp. DM7 TaxID=3235085 RepID=UPI00349E4DB5